MKKLLLAAAALVALASPITAMAEEENNGQDVTKPLTRLDIRTSYADGIEIPGQDDAYTGTVIARIDKPMPMGDTGWTFYYRTDVPFVVNDIPSGDNPDRDDEIGVGDWFNQFVFILPGGKDYPLNIQTFGIGFQAILPTASEDQFGSGKLAFAPLFAWKWKLSDTVQLIPIFKYRRSVGDAIGSGDRPDVSRFEFKPQLNWVFKPSWFMTLYETADWTYQNSSDSADDDNWSIPIDVMVGKTSDKCLFSKKCVYSVNAVGYPVDDYRTNDYLVQFRYGMFFSGL